MSITITVELGERSYPIHIGSGVIDDGARVAAAVPSAQVVIITNEIVAPLYLARLRAQLADRQCLEYVLPDGEAHKNLESFERIMGFMLEQRIERSASVVALGGGVVGDLAGFVAACYQRGVHYVQVPTTLLAQVDSAVGGKTAVNHPLGKNMIGAFYQPRAVLADTAVLDTLPPRELSAGLAEVIKYGLIGDEQFLQWLEVNIDRLIAREQEALVYAVRRSCENKAAVVAGDERESGARALLNLGHTFGHAIETAMGYGSWLHGEAVGAGMCMAARMSARLGWLSAADVERVTTLVARARLPTAAPAAIDEATFREHMSRDKKNEGGCVRLVLLRAIGHAVITSDYPQSDLSAVLRGAN